MLTKFASYEVSEILDVKGTLSRAHHASLDKIADFENYRTDDGYLYVRIRAISSRTNKNHDSWPAAELAGNVALLDHHHSGDGFTVEATQGDTEYGFATFMGKPIFVDHHNSNPKKARGVIVDARLNVLSKEATHHDSYWGSPDVDSLHLPATEVELLLEVDAKSFPRLAQSIVSGDLDGFSMGADVDYSKCSHCGHIAHSSDEYCSHILMKGAHHDFKTADGDRVSRRSFEHCYGVKFFEISAVFDPADETAKAREVRAAVYKEAELESGGPPNLAPLNQDPIRDDAGVADLAMQYQLQGIDPQSAMDMAQRKVQKERGLPGHGEGETYNPKMVDYMPSDIRGMPLKPNGEGGFPPPVDPSQDPETFNKFHQQSEDALSERYPQRPVMNDPRSSSTKTAQNPLPQEMHTRAPEDIDTLRNEQLCPICGNDMEAETCSVCGYVTPPKEFDNPDLDKAKQIREEMKQRDEQATQPGMESGDQLGQPDPNAPGGKPAGPLTSQMPTKGPATANVTNEMHWTPKVHPKTAARINQSERPVTPSNPAVSDEPKNEIVTKDQTQPVTAAMATAQQLMANAKQNHGELMNTRTADGPTPPGDTSPHTRVDVTGVGGVDQASNEQASNANSDSGSPSPHAQVDVTGIGETGTADVSPDKTESLPTAGRESDDSGFNTDKTTEDSGPTSTYGDKDGEHSGITDPVTKEVPNWIEEGNRDKATYNANTHQAYDDQTLEQNEQQGNQPAAQGGSAVQGVQPIDPVATDSYKRVNVLEHQTTPANNSGPTDTWSGTDGNGVLKQQEPVTKNLPETGGVPTPDVQLHTTGHVSIAAIRLAEAEVELGLIPAQEKWNRMAEVDALPAEVRQAKLESYAQVKTAGLERLAKQRQAGATRLPKAFGKRTAAPEGFERIASDHDVPAQPVDDIALDSGLFLK